MRLAQREAALSSSENLTAELRAEIDRLRDALAKQTTEHTEQVRGGLRERSRRGGNGCESGSRDLGIRSGERTVIAAGWRPVNRDSFRAGFMTGDSAVTGCSHSAQSRSVATWCP